MAVEKGSPILYLEEPVKTPSTAPDLKKKVEKTSDFNNNNIMFRRRKKHQVRIRHQFRPLSKRKFIFNLILFSLAIGGLFISNQNKDIFTKFNTLSEDKKDNPPQAEKDSLTNKEIKEQIQKDYKSNLLKHQMAEDSARYKKNKFTAGEEPANPEDYTLKEGVNLSQDESFDDLLNILKKTEADTDEDIEDRIASYRIIEEKIQNFQRNPQDSTTNSDPRTAFAREFIENARKGGYEVKLDNNFKVKSVKKLHTDPYEEALFIEENN